MLWEWGIVSNGYDRKDIALISILLLLALFSVRNLVFSDRAVYWDWPGISNYYPAEFAKSLNLWKPDYLGLPAPPSDMWAFKYPIAFAVGAKAASNVVLLFPVFAAGVAMYALSRHLIGGRIPSFVAGVLYVFNPFFLDRFLQAHIGLLIAYALLPLLTLLALKCFEAERMPQRVAYAVFSGMLLAFITGLQIHFAYLAVFLLFAYVLFNALLSGWHEKLAADLPSILAMLAVALLLLAPTIAYITISPLYSAGSQEDADFLTILSGKNFLPNVIRLVEHPGPGFYKQLGYWNVSYWTVLGLVLPAFAFSAYLFHKKEHRHTMAIFLSLAIVSLFLSTGVTYLREAYLFLYQNFPFFYAFRESSKFLLLTAFSYSILAAIATSFVLSKYNKQSTGWLGYGLVAIILSAHMLSSLPLLTGDWSIGRIHEIRGVDADYAAVGAWISSQNGDFRVIAVPYTDYLYRTWHLVSDKPIVAVDYTALFAMQRDAYQYASYLMESLRQDKPDVAKSLLDKAGVRYIVIASGGYASGSGAAFANSRYAIKETDIGSVLNALKKVKTFGNFTVYEVEGSKAGGVSNGIVLAAGSRRLLNSRSYLPDETGGTLVYLGQNGPSSAEMLLKRSDALVLDSDINDAAFGLLSDAYKHSAYAAAKPSTDIPTVLKSAEKQWIRSDTYEYAQGGAFGFGEIADGGYAVTSSGSNLTIRYKTDKGGVYEAWARVLYGPFGCALEAHNDGNAIGQTRTDRRVFYGFRWALLGTQAVGTGMHAIDIRALTGICTVDQVAIVPAGTLEVAKDRIVNSSAGSRIKYIYESERLLDAPAIRTPDASATYASQLTKQRASAMLEAPMDGDYRILFRANGKALVASVGGLRMSYNLSDKFEWYSAELRLAGGAHELSISGNGLLDLIVLERNADRVNESNKADGACVVALKQAYSPHWRVLGDVQAAPIMVDSYSAGFYMDACNGVRAVFAPQRQIESARTVSTIAMVVFSGLGLLLMRWKR